MDKPVAWPRRYKWLHEYALEKPGAEADYKESWNAVRYWLHGKIFALLVRDPQNKVLLNLKCDPYLSLEFRGRYACVLPGWHMNKLHWISLAFYGRPGDSLCRELVDISYGLVRANLPRKFRKDTLGAYP